MLEEICCKEIDLDDEGNFTMDITKDGAIDKKTLPASEEYLASGRFIKPVTNNDVTKWDAYPKIQNLSKKISRSKTKQRKTFLT